MRITIDIPDPIYRQLKAKAATEGRSVKDLVLEGVRTKLRETKSRPRQRVKLPIVPSKEPGTLHIDNAGIYKIIPF